MYGQAKEIVMCYKVVLNQLRDAAYLSYWLQDGP